MGKKVLLYFNTLKPPKTYNNEDIDFTQFIRFRANVILSDLIVIPPDNTPFPHTSLAKKKGLTSPSNFTFQVLTHTKCIPEEEPNQIALHIDSLDSFSFDYEQASGIQGFQFNTEHEHVTRFLLVRGDFEALTLCLYGYTTEATVLESAELDVTEKVEGVEEDASMEGKTMADDEDLYAGPLGSYQNIISRASKSNDAQNLYGLVQKFANEYNTSGTSDPLLNGTLSRLLDDCPDMTQNLMPSSLTTLGLSKSVHHSVLNLHSQKAWVELRQQICEIDTLSIERTNTATGCNEQLKTLQQSLHRINQLLEDALAYARNNLINFEDDFKKMMKVIRRSMSITSGTFSLSVFRCCLSLVCTLCSCGDEVSRLVLDHQLVQALFLPLRSANTSTNLKVQILKAVNICVNDPLVVQHILEENGINDEQSDSLYRSFILPLRCNAKLPSETQELLEIIVEKIGFFKSCATFRSISFKSPNTAEVASLEMCIESLSRLVEYFNVSKFERKAKHSLELSYFQYLIFHDVLKITTGILMIKDSKSECHRKALDCLFTFYLVVWQTKQGLEYLSSALEKPALGRDHLFDVWVDALGYELDSAHLKNSRHGTLFGWLSEERLRGSPGILDHRQEWINNHEYSHTYACGIDLRTSLGDAASTSSRNQYTLEDFVTVLIYQVYAVRLVTQLKAHSDSKGKRPVLIGKEDYLQVNLLIKLMHDMCIFNVGKQAVASVASFLGALPILISYSSSNPQAKRLVTTIFSYYHLLDIQLSPADFDRLKITYQQNVEDDAVYYTILKYHKHNDLGVLIDILASTERKDFFKASVVDKIAFCVRILLKHSYTGADPLSILSSQLNIVGATQEDPILVYLLRIIESAIENLAEMNKISSLYPDDEYTLVEKMTAMSWSDSTKSPQSYCIERIKMKTKWLELSLLTLELIFSIIYHTGDGLIVSATLTEPDEVSLDIVRDDHLLNECFKQLLKLLYTLDQLDIQSLKPSGHGAVLSRKTIDSYALYLLRSNHEVIYRFFDMVNTVVAEQTPETHHEEAGNEQYRFKCKIPTGLIGNKVVQYLLDGLHDAPQHFLSGIKLLTGLLPSPYIHSPQQHEKAFEDSSLEERKLRNRIYSDNCLRMYWTNQLLPLKDDIEECLRTLVFTSCKEIHISLRLLVVQMVELDIGDLGIARGIFKLLIDQLYEELDAFSRILHATEYQISESNEDPSDRPGHPALGNDESCLWQQSSFEEQYVVSRISCLLCLLLALVGVPSGHFYLLDIFECNIRDGLDQSIGMFFDIIDLLGPDHFVSDLASELISLLSNRWEQFDRRIYSDEEAICNKDEIYAQSTQLSELISNLLDWVQNEKPTQLQTRALGMLANLSRSVIGTLTILSNPEFCYAIHEIMSQSMSELSLGDPQPFVVEKVYQVLGLSKLLYDQWTSHVAASQGNNEIKITLFANLFGSFRTCLELGQACQSILESNDVANGETELHRPLGELLRWFLEVISSLQQESDSSLCRFDEQFDGIEACFLGLERIFQTRKRTLIDFLRSRDLTHLSDKWNDHICPDDFEEIFYFSNEVRDFKAYALRMFPGFSIQKRVKIYDEESDEEGDPVIIPFEPHNVSSLTREELHRKNLGGGKAYQSNEFRNTYGVRKANAARLPSVHVDDFLKKSPSEASAHSNSNPTPPPPLSNLTSSMAPNLSPNSFNSPTRHGYPPLGPSDTSPQPIPRGRMNQSNLRTQTSNRQWPTEARQYRPGPSFPDPLPPNAMVGPPLNDFEVNRCGAFQRGFPPGAGIPSPYYPPHYYPGGPSNQGFYERPYYGPGQFFDSTQHPRPRFPSAPMHMEYREKMEPRFTKGSSFRPSGPGRPMGRPT